MAAKEPGAGETGRATICPRVTPFRQRGPLLFLSVFHKKQNQNQLLPKEM